jgi:hypothetical protein
VISSVFHRRRSERFAQLLDEASGGRRHHVRSEVDDDLTDLVAVSHRLAELPVKVEAHQEFRDGLRAMLMATIERDGIGATAVAPEVEPESRKRRLPPLLVAGGSRRRPRGTRPPLARRTKARGAIVIGLAAGTLALSGMSAASGDSIPGDPLYSVKRSTERAQLALAGSDISRGQLYLEFARTRLDEARAVHSDPAGLTRVLDDMDSETQQGIKLLTTTAVDRKDPAALDAIDAFTSTQRTETVLLRDGMVGEERTRANNSLKLLDEIQRRSRALRLVLKCGAAATSGPDALGPLPTSTSCKGDKSSPAPSGLTGTGTPASDPAGTAPYTDQPGQTGQTGQNGTSGQTGSTGSTGSGTGTGTGNGNSSTGKAPAEGGTPKAPADPTQTAPGGLLGDLGKLVGG